jgi:uncharacterized protein YlxW (UPF0749 family)
MSDEHTPDSPETPDVPDGPSTPDTPGPSGRPEPLEPPEPSASPEQHRRPGFSGAEDAPPQQPEPAEIPETLERPAGQDAGSRTPDGTPGRSSAAGPTTGRQRLAAGLWPPRVTRAQLTAALLLFVLGLGLAIQVRSTSENSVLRGARQEDLVRILDELDGRTQRLEDEKQRLEDQRTELENSSDQAEEARKQTEQKEQQLGVLAGTVAAEGPGVDITVSDPAGAVEADMLLDAIQELRAAGAEAIQINGVRVVADTYFSGGADGVRIDGRKVSQPYRFKVIGKPQDLEPALNIPGGVVQTLEKEQATVSVVRSEKIVVDALRSAQRPDYARSSSR